MTHKCNPCDYETDDIRNYRKHLVTKKHLEKTGDELVGFKCIYCCHIFTTSGGLARHSKICFSKTEMKIEMETEVEKLKVKLAHVEEMNEFLKSENENLKTIVSTAGTIVKSSVSALSYVIKYYNDAPMLEQFTDCASLQDEKDDMKFVKDIIYQHKYNHLDEYIGDYVVRLYKKDDPSKQSIWNTDPSRFTYLTKGLIDKKTTDWKVDKNGVNINANIITPIVDHIYEKLVECIPIMYSDQANYTVGQLEEMIETVNLSAGIKRSIKTKSLNHDVIAYIAPHFYLVR